MKLLLIEDDDNERFTLARVLEHAGYEVVALSRADEALGLIDDGGFHAVVSDVMMPGTDGLSLARAIAAAHPDVPILLMSAFHLCKRQLDRLDVGKLFFFDKPLDIDRLLTVLASPNTPSRGSAPSLPDALPCLQRPASV